MDNASCRHSNEDTTTSMYLSFDAESTMSTACYKTLEAMSDLSTYSVINMDDSENQNKSGDCEINSTLELNSKSQSTTPLNTVKKIDFVDVKLNTPFKALPKNILKEYKALCSTPSKEQLLKTVDVIRGSDASGCVDLGLAFIGIDDEKPAYFPSVELQDENKENVLPDTEEMSTLSTCSSVENTTSVIEKKVVSSISTACSITEEAVENMKVLEDGVVLTVNNCDMNEFQKESIEKTPKANLESSKSDDISETKEEKTTLSEQLEFEKSKATNLQTVKPSSILNSHNKRRSLLPTIKKPTLCIDAESEIPLLMNKMLKITSTSNCSKGESTLQEKKNLNIKKNDMPVNKRSSLMTRTSLLPSAQGNKRPFSFTQRMSVVVKTTLNSPARKIGRRSVLNSAMSSMQRRSVIPKNNDTSDFSKIKKNELLFRNNMVPKPSSVNMNLKNLATLQEISTKPTNISSQRKSIHSLSKLSEKSRLSTITGLSHNKPNISFTCSDCKEKFSIKSLLDAHKRSHESDNNPPAFIKKPLTIKHLVNGVVLNQNQCKYCDKKFALIKALHIHLLQNCPKIPPSEKRKLQFTELNHVEKAQLPSVFHHSLQSNVLSTDSKVTNTLRNADKKNEIVSVRNSTESLNEKKDLQKITCGLVSMGNGKNIVATQMNAKKCKKNTAHTGVYRTPSKAVPCHLCKLAFKNILDYTNHNLTYHGKKKDNDAGITVEKKNLTSIA